MAKKFLRRHTQKLSRLGKSRKKKQKWRKPKGRDNKMREKKKGRPKIVSIGYKNSERKSFPVVNNLKDLEKISEKSKVKMGKMGNRKRLEILRKAEKKKIEFVNFNKNKFLRKKKRGEKLKKSKKQEPKEKPKDKEKKK